MSAVIARSAAKRRGVSFGLTPPRQACRSWPPSPVARYRLLLLSAPTADITRDDVAGGLFAQGRPASLLQRFATPT